MKYHIVEKALFLLFFFHAVVSSTNLTPSPWNSQNTSRLVQYTPKNYKNITDVSNLLTNEFSGPENYIWPTSYSPYQVLCPSGSLVRAGNNTINIREKEYISGRQRLTQFALRKFLGRTRIPNFDFDAFLLSSSKPITIALGVSGGGYRAMLTAAGIVAAFDERTVNSTDTGHLGGLLQSTSYIAGVSGGSWLVMSMLLHDYKSVVELRDDPDGWVLHEPLLEGIPNFEVEVSRNDVQNIPLDSDNSVFDDGFNYDENEDDEDMDEGALDYPYSRFPNKDEVQQMKVKTSIFKKFPWFNGRGEKNMKAGNKIEKGTTDDKSETKRDNHQDKSDSKMKRSIDEDVNTSKYFESSNSLMSLILKMVFNSPKDNNPENNLHKSTSLTLKKIFGFYRDLHIEIRSKRIAGYHISLTDYWGRALSRRIFPRAARSPGATLSSSTRLKSFRRFQQPYPIFLANEGAPSGEDVNSTNSHIFEFTPHEFGSWDQCLNAFVNISYLGTFLYDGAPIYPTENPKQSICVSGFDNAGFLTGTSSSLFNNVFVYLWQAFMSANKETNQALKTILRTFGLSSSFKSLKYPSHHPDYALFTPNPFYGFKGPSLKSATDISKSGHLYLVDGGEDGQNIPFQPLLQRSRNVDVIFAVDTTADVGSFPNGTSLAYSALRYHSESDSHNTQEYFISKSRKVFPYSNNSITYKARAIFPEVPSLEEITSKQLNKRPVFLGCNLSLAYPEVKLSKKELSRFAEDTKQEAIIDTYLPPLVIYLANAEYSFPSNRSTFQLSYNRTELSGMIENGYNIGTYANSTIDSSYSQCVACAILKREFDRIEYGYSRKHPANFNVPVTCQRCYQKFCWN